MSDAGAVGAVDAGPLDAGVPDAGSIDRCPTLALPASCLNRTLVVREWGRRATGDGTFFANQAPGRLGFTRVKGTLWVVKFRTDANTYRGSISPYGDNTGGVAFISSNPCELDAVDPGLMTWSTRGGGTLNFVVARNAADALALRTDAAYRPLYGSAPQLAADTCYYVGFMNAALPPTDPVGSWFRTVSDDCGDGAMTADCYYLSFDFNHLLYDFVSGATIRGHVISGLTQ